MRMPCARARTRARTCTPSHTGFNVCGRYLSVLFYHKDRVKAAKSLSAEQEELDKLKAQYRATRQQAEALAAAEAEADDL